MEVKYTIEPLAAEEIKRWDSLIAPFARRSLFHTATWMQWLAETRAVEARFWAIRAGSELVGYFCGGIFRKGPYKILGTPLKGWLTNDMGPVTGEGFDQKKFFRALDDLAQQESIAMIEMENTHLDAERFVGSEYRPVPMPVYIVPIDKPEAMLSRLHPKARKAVRKAAEFGLRVKPSADGFTEELYDQYREVLARKNLFPTFHPEWPKRLLELLRPRDQMFALDVRDSENKSLATGMFPHDDRSMYFSFTGSRMAGWRLFPNDLLQWTAMEMAAERGLEIYNMCGYGQFKSKFGGELQQRQRWHKAYSRSARWARRGYEFLFLKRMRVRGWIENKVQKQGAQG
jgi:GNAT acetyltransferase-like protein